ncbi:MAG: MarR family winged helix-turn-helix transcriptional regulator [Roseburia sp.]
MEDLQSKIFTAVNQLHKLRIADMFPEMTRTDGMTLMEIGHYNRRYDEAVTVSQLAEKMRAKMSAVSRTLKSLEDAGYIERKVNTSDRRNTYVVLTDRGERECGEIERTMREFSGAVIAQMTEEDMRRLVAYLEKLYQVAKEEIERISQRKKEENKEE